jgi:uncharacterized YigZ family protein
MAPSHPAREAGSDEYLSIESGEEIEFKVKGSRFLAQALRADDEDRAREQLALARKRTHDATHHCSAWRIGPPGECVERSDDDGEPSGTAGRPILAALQREKLFDTFIVVTRYFGGTKLGSGGLLRAYAKAAAQCLRVAPRRPLYQCTVVRISCNYELSGTVENLLGRRAAALREVERTFGEGPGYRLTVLRSHAERLEAELVELTAGRVEIVRE